MDGELVVQKPFSDETVMDMDVLRATVEALISDQGHGWLVINSNYTVTGRASAACGLSSAHLS
jgi:hypothetical protein